MEPQYLTLLLRILGDMSEHLVDLVEEVRELRKEHTALRREAEHMQAALTFFVGPAN